jgi:hypothetical protein
VVEVRGPALAELTSERCTVDALCRGMSHAVAFDPSGHITEPSGLLHKKPLIVERGHFPAMEPYHRQMLDAAQAFLRARDAPPRPDQCAIVETTVLNKDGSRITQADEILTRVARMKALGPVIVSDLPQNYLLVAYLQRYTTEPIHLVMGVSTLARMFAREHYEHLPGTLLEGLGKQLAENVRILAFPMPRAEFLAALGSMSGELEPLQAEKELVTVTDVHLKPPANFLYDYIFAAGWIVEL